MWDHPSPIFLDFETQSAADIKEVGGRLYAEHPSTRVLILSMIIGNEYHVWIPDYIRVDTKRWLPDSLWPFELKPKQCVKLHRGTSIPKELIELCDSHPLVAHNAYGFDMHIWNRFVGVKATWLDSLYLARLSGRPGKLDAIAKQVLGKGKDRASKLLPILTTARPSIIGNGYSYPLIKPGDLQAFTRYAVGDTELLRRLWDEFAEVEVEVDSITAHNNINNRGVKVDIPLLHTIEEVSKYATNQAANDIAEMTRGAIPPDKLRSTNTVHEWLQSYGVYITDESRLDKDGKPKLSLRKDVIQKYIDSPYVIEENLRAVKEIPPVVINVLKLRMKALRITDAKVRKAQESVSEDGRIRDLHGYAVAHTRRASSSRVQIHNLPRPNPWMNKNTKYLLDQLNHKEKNYGKVFDRIKAIIRDESLWSKKWDEATVASIRNMTVDDVCSGLIRPSIMADEGKRFCIADYAAIEARGIAWISDEEKLLRLFREHKDVYRTFASRIYGIDESEVTDTQRQVAKVCILGLGYGMGANKLRIFAASSGVDLAAANVTAEYLVDLYRDTYQKIAGWKPDKHESFRVGGIWKVLGRAVMDCVAGEGIQSAGKCTFEMRGGDLLCHLPSGGTLYYPEARIEDVIPPYVYTLNLPPNPKATVVYTSNRGIKSLFGGLIAENIVQAVCRDLLYNALVKLEDAGFSPVLHVHDEIVCEEPEKHAESRLRTMMCIMIDPPAWAEGFPISAEGFVSPRFVKKAWEGFAELASKNF